MLTRATAAAHTANRTVNASIAVPRLEEMGLTGVRAADQ